jgi:hypothetical protein
MLKQIPKSDIIVRPFKVYKEWQLDDQDISPMFGISGSFGEFNSEDTEDLKKVFYRSIEAQFYRNSETASIVTEVGRRKSYASKDERNLENQFILLPISQNQYGEGIKIGSLVLTDTTLNKTYTDDGYSNLVSASVICGNVFYDRGFVILTKDAISGSALETFNLTYRSTKTIFENEIFISVLESEFNASTNPTALVGESYDRVPISVTTKNWDGSTQINTLEYFNLNYAKVNPLFWEYDYSASADPTGSYLAPYITTIGLYDNEMNIVAVAKLPQPIKSMPDYPLNFIIRFDT